jgi:hypothetical protein
MARVIGALDDTAVDGDPTSTDTVMQYIKQLINTLVGTAGIPTFPAAAAPANAVSLAEAVRQIYDEVAGLNWSAMLGAGAVADAVWDELQADHVGAGSFGETASEIASILADTNELQTDWVNGGRLDLLIDSIISKVDAVDDFLDTEMAAVLAAVDTEVAAILALLDDARTEPGQGNPPVNPDMATKVDYLYKAWRNRQTQTDAEYALYGDDGVTKDQEAPCSDDGTTFERGEMRTGL